MNNNENLWFLSFEGETLEETNNTIYIVTNPHRRKEAQVHLPSPANTIEISHLELLGSWVAGQECPKPIFGKVGVKRNSSKRDLFLCLMI
ncbi:hypothetical protein GBA52_021306 [Prunus armeniaca]|nr:hypothetical protein GBA52_021306 [Prunus armeniaca]